MFDPIVYNEVKKLTTPIGSLALVPNGFKSPEYIDSGSYVDPEEYPRLANVLSESTDVTAFQPSPLPQVSSENMRLVTTSNSSASQYSFYSKAEQVTYVYDQQSMYKLYNTGAFEYMGSCSRLYGPIAKLGSKFYAFANKLSNHYKQYQESTDGLTWTWSSNVPGVSDDSTARVSIVEGRVFMCVSNTLVYWTTDGENWNQFTAPSAGAGLWSFAKSDSAFVGVCGNASTYIRSTDGITWTTHTPPAQCTTIVAKSDLFVMASGSSTTAYYTSPDGITWTSRALPAAAIQSWTGGPDRLYVVASSSLLSTTNGTTLVTVSAIGALTTAVVRMAALPTGGPVLLLLHRMLSPTTLFANVSLDGGATWLPTTMRSNASSWLRNVASGNGCTMCLNDYASPLMRKLGEGSWSMVDTGSFKPYDVGYSAAADAFIAVGNLISDGYVVSFDKGQTWTHRYFTLPVAQNKQVAIVRGEPGVLFVALNSIVATTRDGVKWESVVGILGADNLDLRRGPISIARVGNCYLSLAGNYYNSATTSISVQSLGAGVDSTMQSGSATLSHPQVTAYATIRSLAGNGTIAVLALGRGGTTPSIESVSLLYSADGRIWSPANIGYTGLWNDVVWTGSVFIAVAQVASGGQNQGQPFNPLCAVSHNGIDWHLVNLSYMLENIFEHPNAGELRIIPQVDGLYATIQGVNSVFKASGLEKPYVPVVASPVSGCKYVVKAM